MNVCFSLGGLLFEWDPIKAKRNREKHGVSFETACGVFLDPLVRYVETGDENDLTQAAIGETGDERLLFVVHIVKEQESIRLISARPVTARERREYED